MRLLLWRLLAVLALATGMVGVVLPGLPTVEFLLLAAWAAGKGWPALERWLLAHPRFGPPIRQWREHGAVPRHAKWLATVTMAVSALLMALSSLLLWAKLLIPAIMVAVLVWLWRRPEPPGPGVRRTLDVRR
ncbi:hypothetical protein CEK62_08380 [Alcanivorax sp. N3-2A]|nr:hypothetical protein CEK62_08380 [Alcanivorax sp. N3-2A]